jgi:hypothetical protein
MAWSSAADNVNNGGSTPDGALGARHNWAWPTGQALEFRNHVREA